MNKKLDHLREEIDRIDENILQLIIKRFEIAKKIVLAKGKTSSIYRPDRENLIIRKLEYLSPKITKNIVFPIWRILMSANIYLQKPKFTIVCSKKSKNSAKLFANKIFVVNKKSSSKKAFREFLENNADILIVNFKELTEIDKFLGEKNKVFVSGTIPLIRNNNGSINGCIITKGFPKIGSRSLAIYKNKKNGKIITKNISNENETFHDNFKFLGAAEIFENITLKIK